MSLPIAEFGFPGPLRDRLVGAIVDGSKTTTTSLALEYEPDGDPLPSVGTRQYVIDSAGRPVATIRTVEVRQVPLAEVPWQHMDAEGEGFTTPEQWRTAHEGFWHGADFRASIGDPAFTVSDGTEAVLERFVVEQVSLSGTAGSVDGYADDRLVALYDEFNAGTWDTDFYSAALSPGGSRIADIGCGTGSFAVRLALEGHTVTGIDPAPRMLDVARSRDDAERVTWLEGTARDLGPGPFDAAVMTGHAFQCLLTDEEILETLTEVRRRLVPGGRFMFETRNPTQKAWLDWQSPHGPEAIDSSAGPLLTAWRLIDVRDELVTFEAWTRFERDGTDLADASTLRFVTSERLADLLQEAGYTDVHWFGGWDGATFDAATSREIIVVAGTP
ncbi:methyltransferase domain-containing protein [Arthrobacter echini]|uniref:Methyltransferase domain-containing protein n=1 Tax=Arthrobacter echini TaxID=1529066 RepID=A0A4V3Z5Q7_9MICC|nr:methyltransferase domain-containing protein [Arthrobacter echini]THJ67439.1 methyltransferase domain-containing protein [Arthrobacter echini]